MLLNEQDTQTVWEQVNDKLRFRPDAKYRGHSLLWWKRPFRLPRPWAVYVLDDMTQEQIEGLAAAVKGCLIAATEPGERLYALDWQHSAFLFDPRKDEEQRSVRLEDEAGEYWVVFPLYYPDGDYSFFLDEDFRFGYLGHPWRREIWVFGERLLPEIEQIAPALGWRKLR